jgi:CRISPR-associated protein Cas1
MGVLFLDRTGLELTFDAGALVLLENGKRIRSFPVRLLDRIVLRTNVRLDSAVLTALATQGATFTAIGGRTGQHVAHLVGGQMADTRIRVAQCQLLSDEVFVKDWCFRLVRAKVRRQQLVLQTAQRKRPDCRKPLFDALATIDRILGQLPTAVDRESLRGYEGAAAAAYFKGFTSIFAPSLGFEGRHRRPPPDPVNACLSLGYTLLLSETVSACWANSIDPMVGFLHAPARGRASMACDLMEPWRAQIDRFVWDIFREQTLRPEHFGSDGAGSCVIGKAGRNEFYKAWAAKQRLLARSLRRHAHAVGKALEGLSRYPDCEHAEYEEQ